MVDVEDARFTLTVKAVSKVISRVDQPAMLGVNLLPSDLLVWIEKKYRNDVEQLAHNIAKAWLKTDDPPPTWDKLVEALKQPNMIDVSGSAVQVQEITEKYIQRRGSTTSARSTFSSLTSSFNGSEFSNSGNADTLSTALDRVVEHSVSTQDKRQAVTQKTCDYSETKIQGSFNRLKIKMATKLEVLDVSVSDVRGLVSDIRGNRRFIKEGSRYSKFSRLFSFMSRCRVWSYRDYGLVKEIIELVDDRDSKDEMLGWLNAYIAEYNGYSLSVELADRLPYYLDKEYPDRREEKFSPDFLRDLGTELKFYSSITNESMLFVHRLWEDIQKHFRIPSLTALLYSIVFGSLRITWLIPPSWACCIISEILTAAEFFQEHLITKVYIDGRCVYDQESGVAESKVLCPLWLKQASESGRIENVENVLAQGVNMNANLTTEGDTALMTASWYGHTKLVEFLLANGADSSIKQDREQTALYFAAKEGHSEVANLLAEDSSDQIGQRDKGGISPIMAAAEGDHFETLHAILVHGAGPETRTLSDAFLLAAKKGFCDTVKVLHEHGASLFTTSEEEETALTLASAAGHVKVVEYLISAQSEGSEQLDPDAQNLAGKTALHLAVEHNHEQVIEKLLTATRVDVDIHDNSGMTPLMIAIMKRLPKIVYKLVDHGRGAAVDLVNNDGKTALILAAESGQKECVEILLEKNTNTIFQQESTGKTALHFAAENGHLDVVHLLTQSDYKTDVTIKDKNGKTALDLARGEEVATVLKKAIPVAKQLLETFKKPFAWLAKSNLNSKLLSACKNGALDQVRICLERGADPNYRDLLDLFRWSGLMWASHHGHKDVVRLLLQKKAEPNIENAEGWTALILAARKANHEMVQLLVEHGADVTQRNKEGWTGLMWASQSRGKLNTTDEALENRRKTAEIMIAKDPSVVNISANDGWTPIMQASQDGHAQFVKILVDNKANLELVNKKKWTALMIASKHKRTDVVDALVQGKANVEHQKPDGMTALHVASIKGHKECIEAMVKPVPGVEKKVNVDIKDKWGMTPLILATKHGHKKSAEVLVVAGADVNIRSDEYAGWSPLFFAIKGGYLEIAKFLLVNKASMSTQDENKQTPLSVALGQKKEIYTKLIDFLQGKPQVLKAITSGSETIGSTKPHTTPQTTPVYTPAAAVSQTGEAAVPGSLQKSPTPTLEPVHDTITLKTLIEEAERTAVHRPLKYFKNLEREHNKYMADAMQSGTTAASAA